MVNSVNQDQKPYSAAFDQVYTVCSGQPVRILRVIMVLDMYNKMAYANCVDPDQTAPKEQGIIATDQALSSENC